MLVQELCELCAAAGLLGVAAVAAEVFLSFPVAGTVLSAGDLVGQAGAWRAKPGASLTWGCRRAVAVGLRRGGINGPELGSRCLGVNSAAESWPPAGKLTPAPEQSLPELALGMAVGRGLQDQRAGGQSLQMWGKNLPKGLEPGGQVVAGRLGRDACTAGEPCCASGGHGSRVVGQPRPFHRGRLRHSKSTARKDREQTFPSGINSKRIHGLGEGW